MTDTDSILEVTLVVEFYMSCAVSQVLEDVADDCLLRYNGPGHHKADGQVFKGKQ